MTALELQEKKNIFISQFNEEQDASVVDCIINVYMTINNKHYPYDNGNRSWFSPKNIEEALQRVDESIKQLQAGKEN